VTYESGNGFIYNLCSDCVRDIERFIKTEPNFNAFGYNLDFEKNCEEVYKKCGMSMTREEAIEFLNTDDYESKGYNDAVIMAIEALEEQRPHGEWKPLGEPDDLGIHSWYICSRCGFRTTWHMVDIFHFCPNCGSDNRKEGDEE
jgi:rubrerythrin